MFGPLMNSELHPPPDGLLRGYLYLIHTVFVILRSSSVMGSRQPAYVADLGNAMHNISSLIASYDQGWLDDAKFRSHYLRPFDERWRGVSGAIQLEAELDEFLRRWRESKN